MQASGAVIYLMCSHKIFIVFGMHMWLSGQNYRIEYNHAYVPFCSFSEHFVVSVYLLQQYCLL